jgi:hypothetical protein
MPLHIIFDDGRSFHNNGDDEVVLFWIDVIGGVKNGWHTIQVNQLPYILTKLQIIIDEILGKDDRNTERTIEIKYDDHRIKVPRTSAAFSLVHTYNWIQSSIKQNTCVHILLLPDYDLFHETVFGNLKQSLTTTSINRLVAQFGNNAINVINDFKDVGLIEIEGDIIRLTPLTTEIPFLVGKGSANA